MSVFNEYARYYDLLYRDKDYTAETDYIHNLIQSHSPGARTILNLGCGSGRHDRCLLELGYQITGVDLSEEMLNAAKCAATNNIFLKYIQGDARSVRLNETFDVVISLFHVMSYQTTNHDLLSAFSTAHNHLKPGGTFIFDCWYGPGVLTDPPTVRVKDLADDFFAVTRTAHPEIHSSENVVDVNYRILIKEKNSCKSREITETHRMRYLFVPEVENMLRQSGFELQSSEEWLTAAPLSMASWNALFTARSFV
jgi:SAM-dependent methyltransferase